MKTNARKTICMLLCAALLLCALSSCASGSAQNGKIKILCTVFPIYDWVRAVAGESENIELELLVENGTDLHSFQPSFGDMAKIKDSDIVIYIGGESDKWVAESIDERATGIALSESDGMTLYTVRADSIANAHTHDGEECHEAHGHEHGFDEHIWLSLRNARTAVGEILSVLSGKDAENASTYKSNADSYIAALDALDSDMQTLSESINGPLLFADRFPFVYLLEDYGIDYFAAFEGCSTDTGADFDTVIGLAKKADEYGSTALFVTESPTAGLAEEIIAQASNKNSGIVTLDSMQSIGKSDIAGGRTYLSVMQSNIEKLQKIYSK